MNESAKPRCRVLSIQSHVVHGYVGNKCCVFPLQYLGYEVDHVSSVQFSNHTGYKKWQGTITSADELWDLIQGLQENGLLWYSHLITGYIGSVGLLKTIKKVVEALRAENPDLVYVCDPVLGDDGRLYLPGEMVGLYKSDILPLASLITPNQFEAEQLTGASVQTEQEALQACHALLDQGPTTVVMTSFSPVGVEDQLLLIATTRVKQQEGSWPALKIVIPRLNASFTGTGDLLASLLLARLNEFPNNLRRGVELATASLHEIVTKTYQHMEAESTADDSHAQVMKNRELQLIPNRHLLDSPQMILKAEQLVDVSEKQVLG